MKLTKKQISLGVLSAVTVVTIPVATVISCGAKDTDNSHNIITPDGNLGDAALAITNYALGTPVMNLLTNPLKDTKGFNYPQANLKSIEKANHKEWNVISKHVIYWDTGIEAKKALEKYDTKNQIKVTSMREFFKSFKTIDKKIRSQISGLDDLHKRTLILANSEYSGGVQIAAPTKAEPKKTKNISSTISSGYLEIKVYDTLGSKTDLPTKMKANVQDFLKKSNVNGDLGSNISKLDSQIKEPKDDAGNKLSANDMLRRQWMRNFFVTSKDDDTYMLATGIFDATIQDDQVDNGIKNYTSRNYDAFKKSFYKNPELKMWTETYTDFITEELKQRIVFTEDLDSVSWKTDGGFSMNSFVVNKPGVVFTLSPTIVDLKNATNYIETGINSIFKNPTDLKEMILNQMELILRGTVVMGGMKNQLQIIEGGMPALNGYIHNADGLIKRLIKTQKDFMSDLKASGPSGLPGETKKLKEKLGKIIDRALPEIQKAFANKDQYGKLLATIHKAEKIETRNPGAGEGKALELGKRQLLDILGVTDPDFRTQYMLYFDLKLLSDFSEILVKHWKK